MGKKRENRKVIRDSAIIDKVINSWWARYPESLEVKLVTEAIQDWKLEFPEDFDLDLVLDNLDSLVETARQVRDSLIAEWRPGTERRFHYGWQKQELPLVGRVALIDLDSVKGLSIIGLSDMQYCLIGLKTKAGGVLRLKYQKRYCDAEVFLARDENELREPDELRLSETAAKILGCQVGDDIVVDDIISSYSPILVGPLKVKF